MWLKFKQDLVLGRDSAETRSVRSNSQWTLLLWDVQTATPLTTFPPDDLMFSRCCMRIGRTYLTVSWLHIDNVWQVGSTARLRLILHMLAKNYKQSKGLKKGDTNSSVLAWKCIHGRLLISAWKAFGANFRRNNPVFH